MWSWPQPPQPLLLVGSPTLKEEAAGLAVLHRARGLLTKGSHRSVKSFCTPFDGKYCPLAPASRNPSREALLTP